MAHTTLLEIPCRGSHMRQSETKQDKKATVYFGQQMIKKLQCVLSQSLIKHAQLPIGAIIFSMSQNLHTDIVCANIKDSDKTVEMYRLV